ncbi:unnamed protein product, partial [Mesorhabditis belari]|uniref:Uncharacterized protein n=1 Tax=Mesorhabditis belari TaxID=2138241 RepID=A0AAF3FLD4_9BILA
MTSEELLDQSRKASSRNDVYALGLVIWQLIERRLVFAEYGNEGKFDYGLFTLDVFLGKLKRLDPPKCFREIGEIVESCCDFARSKRPNIEEILKQLKEFKKINNFNDSNDGVMLLKVGLLGLVVGFSSATSDDRLLNEPILSMECKDGKNMYSSFGCNSTYYHCENGLSIKKECLIDLYFDIVQLECKSHSQVEACVNPPKEDHLQVNKDDLPACDGDKDFVSNGELCSRFYGLCENGKVVRKSCPYNNVWIQEDKTCNDIEQVEACKRAKRKEEEGESGTKIEQTTTSIRNDTSEVTTQSPARSWFSCQGKPNGYYAQGCSNLYWACISEAPIQYQCQGMNLFFSAQTLRCDLKQWVPECGGRIQPTTQPPQPQQPQSLPTWDMTALCAKKLNGFYSTPCSREYIMCKNFKTTQFFCPNTLVFDSTISQCNYREMVPSCQSLTVKPTAQPQESPTTPTPATTVLTYNNPIVNVLPWCVKYKLPDILDAILVDLYEKCDGDEDTCYKIATELTRQEYKGL